MDKAEKTRIAQNIASYLAATLGHMRSTRSFDGIGEITLRDGLTAVLAAHSADARQGWNFFREYNKTPWKLPVDFVVTRNGNQKAQHLVGAVELKIWRQRDSANASARRTALLVDIYKAAAFHSLGGDFSFVALAAERNSWKATAPRSSGKTSVFHPLFRIGKFNWDTKKLDAHPSAWSAIEQLCGCVPIAEHIQTELLAVASHHEGGIPTFAAGVWSVRKNQNSREF